MTGAAPPDARSERDLETANQRLRICLHAPAVVQWSLDAWRTQHALHTQDSGLSLHVAALDLPKLAAGAQIDFSFRRDNEVENAQRYRIQVTG